MSDTLEPSEDRQQSKSLAKKEKREAKKKAREEEVHKQKQREAVQTGFLWVLPVLVLIGIGWMIMRSPEMPDEEDPLISGSGIHWHADLDIVINGEPVTIPANIGLTSGHADTHTHKVNDQIHLEMNRPVRLSDTQLGLFFDVWGEEFSSECVMDVCNEDGKSVRMYVNGEENFEFAAYHMKDGDQIEIRYE